MQTTLIFIKDAICAQYFGNAASSMLEVLNVVNDLPIVVRSIEQSPRSNSVYFEIGIEHPEGIECRKIRVSDHSTDSGTGNDCVANIPSKDGFWTLNQLLNLIDLPLLLSEWQNWPIPEQLEAEFPEYYDALDARYQSAWQKFHESLT